jgi:hypothetical protein
VKGEVLMKLAFHTAQRMPFCLREEAWAALLRVLCFSRSRGALPSTLALVPEDFAVHRGSAQADGADRAGSSLDGDFLHPPLPPSPYAHRCYLEAYGLTLSYPGQSAQDSPVSGAVAMTVTASKSQSSGGGGWLAGLFSAPAADESPESNGVIHSGTLDLPNLYSNTNASVCVDMTGEPLRPDDDLLRTALMHCQPASLLYSEDRPEHFASTAIVLRTMLRSLTAMVADITAQIGASSASQKEGGLFKTSFAGKFSSISRSRDEEDVAVLTLELPSNAAAAEEHDSDAFPSQLLDTAEWGAKDARELDAVAMLEWAANISLKSALHVQYFWPELCGALMLLVHSSYLYTLL